MHVQVQSFWTPLYRVGIIPDTDLPDLGLAEADGLRDPWVGLVKSHVPPLRAQWRISLLILRLFNPTTWGEAVQQ